MTSFDTLPVAKAAPITFDLLDIQKSKPLSKVALTIDWGNGSDPQADADLVAVLLHSPNARVSKIEDLVYYRNTVQQGIKLYDARRAGDQEKLEIDLDQLPDTVVAVAIYAVVYSVENPGMTFGRFDNPHLNVIDADTGDVTHQLNLQSAPDSDTFCIGTFFFDCGWKFKTSGENSAFGATACRTIGNYHATNSFQP